MSQKHHPDWVALMLSVLAILIALFRIFLDLFWPV